MFAIYEKFCRMEQAVYIIDSIIVTIMPIIIANRIFKRENITD